MWQGLALFLAGRAAPENSLIDAPAEESEPDFFELAAEREQEERGQEGFHGVCENKLDLNLASHMEIIRGLVVRLLCLASTMSLVYTEVRSRLDCVHRILKARVQFGAVIGHWSSRALRAMLAVFSCVLQALYSCEVFCLSRLPLCLERGRNILIRRVGLTRMLGGMLLAFDCVLQTLYS